MNFEKNFAWARLGGFGGIDEFEVFGLFEKDGFH
jgi:hypothetical protein